MTLRAVSDCRLLFPAKPEEIDVLVPAWNQAHQSPCPLAQNPTFQVGPGAYIPRNMCTRAYLSMYVHINACICIYSYVYVHVYVYMYICICICICTYVSRLILHIRPSIEYISLYTHIHIHIFTCACLYVFICATTGA